MATKIRLARRGRKRKPIYNIVVADARAPRDGKYIERLGLFNPNVHPPEVTLDTERALQWILTGAQPTETAKMILSKQGVMLKKHLAVGVRKGALTQEQANEKYSTWLDQHGPQVALDAEAARKAKAQADAQAKAEADAKARAEAEAKRKEDEAKAAEEAKKAEAEAKAAEEASAAETEAEVTATAEEAAPAEETAAEAKAEDKKED